MLPGRDFSSTCLPSPTSRVTLMPICPKVVWIDGAISMRAGVVRSVSDTSSGSFTPRPPAPPQGGR
jgi:hypothetical protein